MSEATALRIEIERGLQLASPEIRAGLAWFDLQVGTEIAWPSPCPVPELEHLVITQKGIYKPRESLNPMNVALSIRNNIESLYDDELRIDDDLGVWTFRYRFEGRDVATFTNGALVNNYRHKIPVGVLVQTKRKPSRYRVYGLAMVATCGEGFFDLKGVARTN